MILKDSGERREFTGGAVRDCADGKGRCDLLPLKQVSELFEGENIWVVGILNHLNSFLYTGDTEDIYRVVYLFIFGILKVDMQTAILEVSKQYEDGARKYNERNWEKGIPLHCYIDSGIRHLLKYVRGDNDEPHERAFMWNMFGLLWTLENKPEMNDLPFKK